MSHLLQFLTICCLAIAAHGIPPRIFERNLLDQDRSLRLCVTTQAELDKCNVMQQMLLDQKTDYNLECCKNPVDICIQMVRENKCDFVVLEYQDERLARNLGLRPYLFEEYSKDSYIVAVADEDLSAEELRLRPLDFDIDDLRQMRAALFFDALRQERKDCSRPLLRVRGEKSIRLMRSNQLKEYNLAGKALICPDLKLRDLDAFAKCNFDTGSVRAIYGRDGDNGFFLINYFRQLMSLTRDGKGRGGYGSLDESRLLGALRGLRNILFDDDVLEFSLMRKIRNGLDEYQLDRLFCLKAQERDASSLNEDQQLLDMSRNRLTLTDEQPDLPYQPFYRSREYELSDLLNPNFVYSRRQLPLNYFDANRQFYDQYPSYYNLGRLPQLSDADRFRQMLNIEQYRQQYLTPRAVEQNLNKEYRPTQDANRDRLPYDFNDYRQLQLDRQRSLLGNEDYRRFEAPGIQEDRFRPEVLGDDKKLYDYRYRQLSDNEARMNDLGYRNELSRGEGNLDDFRYRQVLNGQRQLGDYTLRPAFSTARVIDDDRYRMMPIRYVDRDLDELRYRQDLDNARYRALPSDLEPESQQFLDRLRQYSYYGNDRQSYNTLGNGKFLNEDQYRLYRQNTDNDQDFKIYRGWSDYSRERQDEESDSKNDKSKRDKYEDKNEKKRERKMKDDKRSGY